jgi:hypothetical protein
MKTLRLADTKPLPWPQGINATPEVLQNLVSRFP